MWYNNPTSFSSLKPLFRLMLTVVFASAFFPCGRPVCGEVFNNVINIDSQTTIDVTRYRYDRRNGELRFIATITNISAEPLGTPILLAFYGLPQGITLVTNDALSDGTACVNYTGQIPGGALLQPGATTEVRQIAMINPGRLRFQPVISVWGQLVLNDDCDSAEPVGEVMNLPFDTTNTTFDGPGLCMTSPNIWFVYTASCTGDATVSLLGSSFDTMLAVYDGCVCPPTSGDLLACNDDSGGTYQSQVTLPAIVGNEYLIEIGGFGSETGQGVLSISCEGTLSCPVCQDLNGDGVINTDDLVDFTANWLEHCPDTAAEPDCLCYDVNGDGVINLDDLVWFTVEWMENCLD